MATRLQLHSLLISTLPDTFNVNFKPPATLIYPCVNYTWVDEFVAHAANSRYITERKWRITIIERESDSLAPDKIGNLPKCKFVRRYIEGGLFHTIYELYF